MPDDNATQQQTTPAGDTPGQQQTEPPAGQTPAGQTQDESTQPEGDELAKWKAMARKHEQQAKANADAAKKLAELEERDKTEAQKAADKAAAAEQRATEAEQRALRYEVAASKGVPADLLSGSSQEEMEERADALIAFRGEAQSSGDKSETPRRPTEQLRPGASSSSSDKPEDPLLRDLKAKIGIQ